ncbi:protein-disulfide reductase DsbD family protein [Bdellovibrio sp. HCB117]|uniref:protein-disulfide reductase DsbD family protein n=1 Tax=Bdellovibrio sp. HCB117 TaxID=3394359 RepID=UPI0039B66FBF
MKRSLKYILAFTLLLLTSPWSWAQLNTNDTDPLLVETKVIPFEWNPGQGGTLEIKMKLPPGYHAYDDQFKVVILEPDGFQVAPLNVAPLKKWFDKFSKKERLGIENEATLQAHIEAPNRFLKKHDKMKLELTYQACSDQFCLFPTTKLIEVPITVTVVEGSPQIVEQETTPAMTSPSFFDSGSFQKLLGASMFTGLLFVFLAGVFTSFTPCIFPMIPITLAVLGNHANERSRLQNFITACVYVLGIATTYSVLGLVAASTGGVFGATLGNPYVLAVICVIFLAMALSMYGLYEIQVPAAIRNRFGAGQQKKGLGGAYLTGLFAGIVASPCVGPVLVAILTYVASTQNKVMGFLFLFTYAVGLGLIFIAMGVFTELSRALPRSGPWMNAFKFILGTLMLSAFYYYLELLLPERWFDLALGVGLIILASVYGAFLAADQVASPLNKIRKGLMQAVLLVGVGYIALAAFELRPYIRGRIMANDSLNQIQKLQWQVYSEDLLAEAAKNRKPVIIDFWAEWCAACHELEEHTFSDARVRAMGQNFVFLKFDATKDSDKLRELKKKYGIQGLPTVIFINPNGVWIDALTLTMFEKADAFLKRMEKAAQ